MKKVAIYLRLSKEDEHAKDESNSISNQRQLLLGHIRTVPEFRGMEVIEFKDDGYSGKNMERPGVQELLQMVRDGKIAAILCKDISRYSRDYLVVGKYMEQIFPFMGVRFIAVNDHYDSNHFSGGIAEIDVAFKEILYDYYSEDLSVKLKSALYSGKRNGKFLARCAPYGYKKDPEDRHKVVVDEEAAKVVADIFGRAVKGESYNSIALALNEAGVECPSAYMERTCGAKFHNRHGQRIWTRMGIRDVLSNEFYTGTYVFHKSEIPEVGGKVVRIKDRDKWERIYGHHPAIVAKEDFEAVQDLVRGRRAKQSDKKKRHFLSGKLVCGICGANLVHSWHERPKYICTWNYSLPHAQRHVRNIIRDEDLERAILGGLEKEAALRADADRVREESKAVFEAGVSAEERRLAEQEDALERIYEKQKESYEDYRMGKTDRERYLLKKEQLDRLEAEAQELVGKQRNTLAKLESEAEGFTDALSGILFEDGKLSFDRLTEEMADTFVDRIHVWPGGRVEIGWKFQG